MSPNPFVIVYSGPMFAGKTTSLIEAYKNSSVPNENKIVFKYANDTRYSNNAEIVTHDNARIPCIMITECADITKYLNTTYNNLPSYKGTVTEIYIDECQFLPDIFTWIKGIKAQSNNLSIDTIVIAGLDLDATGKPFTEAFKNVMEIADINYSLSAKCYICSKPAQYTKLLKTENLNKMVNNVLIGGADLYQPVCEPHFQS